MKKKKVFRSDVPGQTQEKGMKDERKEGRRGEERREKEVGVLYNIRVTITQAAGPPHL